MTAIPKTITLDPYTEPISKKKSLACNTPESTIMRYILHCWETEPTMSMSQIEQRLSEPSTREVYLNEMKLAMYIYIEKQQPGISVHCIGSDKNKRSIQAPSGRRYSFGPMGIRVTDPEDIAFFKREEAGSGFKVVDSRVEVEAEE